MRLLNIVDASGDVLYVSRYVRHCLDKLIGSSTADRLHEAGTLVPFLADRLLEPVTLEVTDAPHESAREEQSETEEDEQAPELEQPLI